MSKLTILFEGVDGAGKTYALNHLKNYFESKNLPVHVVDSIPYETFLRSHDPSWFNLNIQNVKYVEYLAWQVNNFYKNIQPYLKSHIILVDRFVPSCYAYNSLDKDDHRSIILGRIMEEMFKFWQPDYTFWFDVSNDVLIERHKQTEQPVNLTSLPFVNSVRERYTQLCDTSWPMTRMNGSEDIQSILTSMLSIVNTKLQGNLNA
jgi:thymidylate kinase